MSPSAETSTHGPGPNTGELRKLGAGVELGRYTLLRRIAAGGMAEVYTARIEGIEGFEKKVAIKKILPQFSMNKRFIDMIVDEAKIAVTLTHPNIAQVYELGLEGDTYYIVMEYVDGRPLNRLLQKVDIGGTEKLDLEHAVHIVGEVAKGLHHAHIQKDARGNPLNIVHRDVSPQNILLSYAGQVKVIDFGIARAAGRVAHTSVGVIKGKLRYLAPEIAVGEEPDARSDVYCCGIVLFELLTGEAMFAPRTDLEAIELASKAIVRSPRLSNPEVPADLEDIVLKALRRERSERYSSAKELYGDLRRFLNHHHPAYVGSELGDRMQQLFKPEMEEDRQLDEVAERIVLEVRQKRAEPQGPERRSSAVAASADPSPGQATSPSYKQLVTRSIEIVPGSSGSAEAESPDRGAASEAPTVALDTENEPSFSGAAKPSTATSAAGSMGARRMSILFGGMFLGALSVLFAVWLGFSSANSGGASEAVTPSEKVEPAPSVGSVRIRIEPPELEGEVQVFVDGKPHSSGTDREVKLELSLVPHQVDLYAEGWELPRPLSFTPEAGQSLVLEARFEPLGTIVVSGEYKEVKSSGGIVVGGSVRNVPLGVDVEVRVSRERGGDYVETVRLSDMQRERKLQVPEYRAPRPGQIKVTAYPESKVYVDGRLRGTTPFNAPASAGRHTVRIEAPDGRKKEVVLDVPPGKAAGYHYQWPRR